MLPCQRIFMLLLFLAGLCRGAYAQGRQDYVVTTRHLSADDGLVTDAVVCGLQDALGFVWLGTPDGLQRYDGLQFKLFTREKNGLQANHVTHMSLAADSLIWVTYAAAEGRIGGKVDLLDAATGKATPFRKAFGAKAPVGEQQIFVVLANEEGDIFIITLTSDVWMYRRGRFRKIYDHPAALFFTRATWHHKVSGGHLWLSSADMGCVHVDTSGAWRPVSYPGGSSTQPLSIYADGSAMLWVTYVSADTHPLKARFLLARPDGKMEPAAFDPYTRITARGYEDYYLSGQWDAHTGSLGFQNRSAGISLLLADGQTIVQIVDSASMAALNNAVLEDCFSDAAGKYWFCTARGIFIADVRPNNFRHYLDKTQLQTPIAMGNQTRGICHGATGTTWAALWDGMYEFSESNGAILRRVPGRNPTVLYKDGTHLWGVTRDFLTDLTGKASSTTLPGTLGKENEIWALHRDGDRLYAGTIQGIFDITGPAAEWKRLPGQGDDTGGWCYGFFRSTDGILWATTTNGLLCINGGRITDRYAADAPDTAHRLPATDIHYLYEDAANDFWLCTNGSGLLHWQRRSHRTTQYTVADGLSSNTLYALLPDEQGNYWISSDRGLMRFDPRSGAVKTYTVKDGLADNEFNRLSVFKASNGRMYFGGINGLISFDPRELNSATAAAYQAPMRVSSLYRYNAAHNQLEDHTPDLLHSNTISIKPEDGFYTLNFQLLDFEPQQHTYAYQIEGLEKEWNYINEGSLRLGNLPYGNYTLRIKGKHTGGGWSTKQLVISLHVLQPFYRQVWFILMVTIVAAALIWLGIVWRERRLRRANEQLEHTVSARTGELAQMLQQKDLLMKEIHHRVKNNLQVISSLQQMQASRSHDPAVKTALADSQNRVLSIAFIHQNLYQHDDLKGVEMQSFVEELTMHLLAVYTHNEKIIRVKKNVAPVTLDIDTAVPLGLILNELLTNSCKHAFRDHSDGYIDILLTQEAPGNYKLEYRDDGPGLGAAFDLNKTNSMGLRLINRLAEQLDGILQYKHAPDNQFSLSFRDFERRNVD